VVVLYSASLLLRAALRHRLAPAGVNASR
jgi:hypothetical protein